MKILFIAALVTASSFANAQFTKAVPKPVKDTVWAVVPKANSDAPLMLKMNASPLDTIINYVDSTIKNDTVPLVITSTPTVQNLVRPIVSLSAYSLPGWQISAGAGGSLQHLTCTDSTKKWYCKWSVSALVWAGGTVAPTVKDLLPTNTPKTFSYGIMVGVLNNLIQAGPAYDGQRWYGKVAVGISLNN